MLRRVLTALILVATIGATASGCSAAAPPAPLESVEADAWVVIHFSGTSDNFDLDTMDALLGTETAADEALQSSDSGWIDGNDIGNHEYNLYFNGYDRDVMWGILEPIFAQAPVSWTSVELRTGLDDDQPTLITP